jgi:hypothetical protein
MLNSKYFIRWILSYIGSQTIGISSETEKIHKQEGMQTFIHKDRDIFGAIFKQRL